MKPLCALAVLLLFAMPQVARAQQWTDPVRGSWIGDEKTSGGIVLANAQVACDIVVADDENSAVKQAAKFLAGDIEKISGQRPAIVNHATQGKVAIVLKTKPTGEWEAYAVHTDHAQVMLSGSDFRGTAYAAYELSQRLGIDPLYLWTGYTPVRHNPLILKPTNFSSGPPTVKYRGLFHDDEDILPRPFDDNGLPLMLGDVPTEWYAKYFETALRLRMNMVAPWTRVHRRHEVVKMASDWGLFYTSHHYDILLSNPYGFKHYGLAKARGVEDQWDWFNNRDGMLRYWRGGVEENKDLNCIWPVGLRATDDGPYKFPRGTSEADEDKVFKNVIDDQVKMTKALLPADKQPPIFHFTLYTEMLEKYQTGKLQVPDDVIIVWPDDNDGTMRGLPTKPDRWKHGVYYHLAYLGKQVKQNANIVSPWRIAEQFRHIVDAHATEFMLVNVSELREFVMEARMLGDICWDAKTALAGDSPADRYVDWWSREYFGNGATSAAKVYRDYAKLLDSYDKQWAGSDDVQRLVEAMSNRMNGKKFNPPPAGLAAQLHERNAQYAAAFADADAAMAKMNWMQKQYFFENALLPMVFDYRPTQAAEILVKAFDEPDHAKALAICHQAMKPLERMQVEILRAERPPFQDWYRHTFVRREMSPFNVHRPYEQMRLFLSTDGAAWRLTAPPLPRHATTKPASH